MKITRGIKPKPRNVLVFGRQGSGKSTYAAGFPDAIMIDIEGGSDDIDIARGERVTSYEAFQSQMSWLITADHPFKWVVTDTIDWLEKLIWAYVCRVRNVSSMADIDYGKGYDKAFDEAEKIITAFRCLNNRGIGTLTLGHAKAAKHTPPGKPAYDRWEPDLHEKFKGPFVEFMDEIFFIEQETFTITEDQGFGKSRGIATTTSRRILYTSDNGISSSKTRIPSMPGVIEANYGEYAKFVAEHLAKAKATPVTTVNEPAIEVPAEPVKPVSAETKELESFFDKAVTKGGNAA